MSELTQDNRSLSITTPLPKDELLLTSFEGQDQISDLFEYRLETLSKNHAIQPEQLVGKPVTVTIQNDIKPTFNGYVSSFTYGEVLADDLRTYRLTMVPWLWFLSKTNNHRIFQEKSTKDIVMQVFKDLGFNDFDYKAEGNPTPREYCVQHNESDLNFVSRLLEEDGIAYYFEQGEDKHVMHIVDAANAYQECKETNLGYSKGSQPNTQFNRWEHLYDFRKGAWSINDYDHQTPGKSQRQTSSTNSQFANVKQFEHYEYSPYHDFASGKKLVAKRMEAEEVPINTIEGSSDCSSFYAGGRFKLSKHAIKEEQGSYIITSIRHKASDSSYLAGGDNKTEYSNDVICIPESVHFRPQAKHQKPWMQGPQSATVVGPKGEEIYIDNDRRIKVQFHWDREGGNNETSSCFIRVMQPWAGSGWGTSFIPRIGMEVVVNFFDGDPDRPIIMGSVYNGDNKPPFDSKTQSGIRTRSSKGGSKSNFNEFSFDDAKGSENFYMHAEKNMNVEIKNDLNSTVNNNQTVTIKKDAKEMVQGISTYTFNGNSIFNFNSNYNSIIGGDVNLTVVGKTEEKHTGAVNSYFAGAKSDFYAGAKADFFAGAKSSMALAVVNDTFVGAKLTSSLSFEKKIVGGYTHTHTKVKELRKTPVMDIEATQKYKVISPNVSIIGKEKIILAKGKSQIMIKDGVIHIKATDIIVKGNVTVKGDITPKKKIKGKNIESK